MKTCYSFPLALLGWRPGPAQAAGAISQWVTLARGPRLAWLPLLLALLVATPGRAAETAGAGPGSSRRAAHSATPPAWPARARQQLLAAAGSGSWQTVPGPDGPVSAIALIGTDVYIGGKFTSVGGVAASNIAKWNGSRWSALGTGTNASVQALAVMGTTLYAGGSFTQAGDVAASHVARWDGASWSPLGKGLTGGEIAADVQALSVSGNTLYAGGFFGTAGDVSASLIAKWDGSSWSALGTGLNTDRRLFISVQTITCNGSDVYAGGYFTLAGGRPANYVAKWNGTSWSALGAGVNYGVYSLAVSGTSLYAGGAFYGAGGEPVNNIARWDGSSWSALGTGIQGYGYALAVSGSHLYAGGDFTVAGGAPALRIADWDGTNWSAVGPGLNGRVAALLPGPDGTLYVGGDFTALADGSQALPYFGIYRPAAAPGPAPTLSGFSPASGGVGTVVRLTGTDLGGATAVSFNGTPASSFAASSGTSLTAVVAPGTTTGPIMVTTPAGAATTATSFVVSAVAASGLRVLYQTGDAGQPTDNVVRPYLQLVNAGAADVPYQQLTLRYWLTVENFAPLVAGVEFAQLGTSQVQARYVALPAPRQGAYGYVEYTFLAGAGSLAAGGSSGPIFSSLHKQDWTDFDETDDFSYLASPGLAPNDHLTLYQNGVLVGGTEPAPEPAATSLRVYAGNQDTAPSTSYVSVYLQVGNVGNQPVSYADLTVRYWLTPEGSQPLVYSVDYARLGAGSFGLQTGQAGSETYAELRAAGSLGTLYPRSSTGNIQFRIRRDDYGALYQPNDYSFGGSPAIAEQPRITAYLGGQLVYGTEPAGATVASQRAARAALAAPAAGAAAAGPLAVSLTGSPNPAASELRLQFSLAYTQAYALAVYDGQGRLVRQLPGGTAPAGQPQQLALPVSELAAGLYLVRLTTATDRQQLKFIKQ